jgi:hypothetical protein
MITSREPLPRRPPRSLTMLAMIGLISMMGTVAGVLGGLWLSQPTKPVHVLKFELQSNVLEPGEPLKVDTLPDRDRHCPSKTIRWVIDSENNSAVWSETVDGGYSSLGRERIISTIRFGVHPVGKYEYTAMRTDYCENGTYVDTLPRLPFEIAARKYQLPLTTP